MQLADAIRKWSHKMRSLFFNYSFKKIKKNAQHKYKILYQSLFKLIV